MLRDIFIAFSWMLFVQLALPDYTGNQHNPEFAYQRDVKPAVYIINNDGGFNTPQTLSI